MLFLVPATLLLGLYFGLKALISRFESDIIASHKAFLIVLSISLSILAVIVAFLFINLAHILTICIGTIVTAVILICVIINSNNIAKIFDNSIKTITLLILIIFILSALSIPFTLLIKSGMFFLEENIFLFIFGTEWSVSYNGTSAFGSAPLILGTLYIGIFSIAIASFFGIISAIYISEYVNKKYQRFISSILSAFYGVPSFVYGMLVLYSINPMISKVSGYFALQSSATPIIGVSIGIGIMLIPMVTAIAYDIVSSIPKNMRFASYGLGATKEETIINIVLPYSRLQLLGVILLAFSRAISETMIVVMAAGVFANITLNPLESMSTITVKIVSQITGELDPTSIGYVSSYALGALLLMYAIAINCIANKFINPTYK